MERFHWVQHRCRQLLLRDSQRGWYSPPEAFTKKGSQDNPYSTYTSGKRRAVFSRHGPHQHDGEPFSRNYKSNAICTTKYSLLTFIPMNLFEQFHRAANLYFLFLALLNWVPVVEAFQKEITMIPLLVVLIVIAIKDALEDYRRYLFDKKVNNNVVNVFCGKQKKYVDHCWKDVQVGDFVRLSCNEIIPADMLLLYSSDPRGVCYIETANLDGETNLKQRQVVSDLPFQGAELSPESFHSRIECENPNNDLSRFRGYMEHSNGVRVGLHNSNLLLRSCTIRNTETVVGIVVYAGHETKAMMNNSGPRYKRSQLEKRLNTDILWCVVLLIIMCLTAAIGHGLWLKDLKEPVFQVDEKTSPALAGFYVFWTMIIVLQVLIPISLYVSIEIVKLGQVYFIQNDLALYNEQLDSRINCRALNITEDLGRIQYLFSDKTGTLTENKMVFRRCSIFGVEYPHEENAQRLKIYEEEKENKAVDPSVTMRSGCSGKSLSCHSHSCTHSSVSLHTITAESEEDDEQMSSHKMSAFFNSMAKDVVPDPELLRKFNFICSPEVSSSVTPSSLELSYITDFFLALAICNSVVVSLPGHNQHLGFEAAGPQKSLEDIKLMFQHISFTPNVALPALSSAHVKNSPSSLTDKLFTQMNPKQTDAFNVSSSPNITAEGQESNLKSSDVKGEVNISRIQITEGLGQLKYREAKTDVKDTEINTDREMVKDQFRIEDTDFDDKLVYEAESPDEAALVHAARAYRCTLRGRSAESLAVDLLGLGSLTVELLHILPFDSNRKRMSVVVRHPITGQVVVYTKGADSVIMDLAKTPKDLELRAQEVYTHIRDQTQKHLDSYASEGLRTLCVAKKDLKEEEYKAWLTTQLLAERSIENREDLMHESAQRLETNLTLLGATGIVDRLQEEVPETIEAIQKAGIKVWVLTGDKQETAINIAHSCKLLCSNDQLLTANCEREEECIALLAQLKLKVKQAEYSFTAPENYGDSSSDNMPSSVMVIDGRTLNWVLQGELKSDFLELSCGCKAVICCRSTPMQKSQVVRLIRNQLGVITLAVGDGANDVSMIQTADVGIGIFGQEGMQAVMSSDFAISRFKHLRKLLLVHGHWCYSRLANMILYFFYKNVMYVNLLFWYQFFCGFSGSVMTNSWVLIFFNLLFTSVPPLIYGILDKEMSADTLMYLPELYQAAQTSKIYVPHMFWITVLDAFYQSIVCFFVPYFALAGSDIGELSFGSSINASALIIILLHQVLESHTLTWIHAAVLVLSGAFYFGFVLVFSVVCVTCSPPTNPVGVEILQMSQPLFYIICALTTVIALLPRLLLKVLYNTLHPSAVLKSSQISKVDSEMYHRKMQHWNLSQTRVKRLPVCDANPSLEPAHPS